MRPSAVLVVPLVLAALAAGLAGCGADDDTAGATPTTTIPGVQTYVVGKYTHVKVGAHVDYDRHPPVGGTHWAAPGWAQCGFYDQPVPDEAAVHDLEHGAVWVAYRSDLPATDIEILHQLVRTDGHLLVTPYADLRAPIVATAWGAQLDLPAAGDGRLVQFIAAYTNADSAPEGGATCGKGDGVDAKPVKLD